jgi:hypothetical protein
LSLTYKILSYQSIFDSLTSLELDLNKCVQILQASDLDLDSELTGELLVYEVTDKSNIKGGQIARPETPTTETYKTNSRQNLFDVCLMTLGDLNKIVSLTNESGFNNINDYPDGVINVTYNLSDITDNGFKLAIKKANIDITTGIVYEPSLSGYLLQEDLYRILQGDGYRITLS